MIKPSCYSAIRKLGIQSLFFWLSVVLFLLTGCSGTSTQKLLDEDQVIQGPFIFTPEWTEVVFNPPLEAAPHLQELSLMLPDQYVPVEVIQDEIYNFSYGYKDSITGEVIRPEVLLITEQGGVYKTKVTSGGGGWTKIPQGNFSQIGYASKGEPGQFIYPKGTKIVSAKIRANTTIHVEHLYWNAWHYFKAPNRTWQDVKPDQVVYPQDMPHANSGELKVKQVPKPEL